jgi:hypothetical protein
MKRTVATAAVLAFSLTCFAQSQSNDAAQNSDKNQKKINLEGCVKQSAGSFYLVDTAHPSGIQIASSQDLSQHVGHKVRIEGVEGPAANGGTVQKTPATVSEDTGSKEKTKIPQGDDANMADANKAARESKSIVSVTNLDPVSGSCDAGSQ